MASLRTPSVVLAMAPANPHRLFDDQLRQRLRAIAAIDLDLVVTDLHAAPAREAFQSAEVLLTCWGCPPVDADVLATAPRLEAIVHAAGSVKGLVTEACWRRGLRVSSAAAANAVPVAEYTVAMIVLAGKRAFPIQAAYRAEASRRDWAALYPGLGNYRVTVGIVGASNVGRRVVDLLQSYDMDVLLADPTIDAAEAARLGARLVELDELIPACDVVSIHAPDIPQTYHLFDAGRLASMRDGATLVNTARGRIVDTEALTVELTSGRISAVLDVTDPEPLPADSPLFALPNVVLTPHIAGSLGNEIRRMGALAVAELERFARGEAFAYPVVEERLSLLA
ncbi:hydroxyacid dehydrogenase [Actinopolymorpha alba]|uniref:hydroxyacid dehydrogenase n=1 Tax=Actinopolymorpha alba TaxID=533267 RepID=UPI00036EBB81|nr:hydroxyacid dehydrogenase [Actinopolymorpha alba]